MSEPTVSELEDAVRVELHAWAYWASLSRAQQSHSSLTPHDRRELEFWLSWWWPQRRRLDPVKWTRGAACLGVDPNVMHPERGESWTAAHELCAGCPIIVQCAQAALEQNEKHGVWGGLAGSHRRTLRRVLLALTADDELDDEHELPDEVESVPVNILLKA